MDLIYIYIYINLSNFTVHIGGVKHPDLEDHILEKTVKTNIHLWCAWIKGMEDTWLVQLSMEQRANDSTHGKNRLGIWLVLRPFSCLEYNWKKCRNL